LAHQKKIGTVEPLQNRRFYLEVQSSLLLAHYIGERRTKFVKAYGIKVRCYGEHVGEHIGNLMGTHWELKGDIGTNFWSPKYSRILEFFYYLL
jgi:hypothetical protein